VGAQLQLRDTDVYKALGAQARAIETSKGEFHAAAGGNFSEIVAPTAWPYAADAFRSCVVRKTLGVRVRLPGSSDAQWYLISGLSNGPIEVTMPDGQRQYLVEYVGVARRKTGSGSKSVHFVDPLAQRLRPKGNLGMPRAPFSTSFERWGGSVGLSAVYNMVLEEVPALIGALDMSNSDASQAIDALTASNLAILGLPLLSNLVPVSALTTVPLHYTTVLFYVLMSDVLTSVPWLIKGLELVTVGRRSYEASDAWFTGDKAEMMVVAELWGCQCELVSVERSGLIIIFIGVTLLAIGLVLEFFAWRSKTASAALFARMSDEAKTNLLQRHLERGDLTPNELAILEEEAALRMRSDVDWDMKSGRIW
jgi:hypothetical protein